MNREEPDNVDGSLLRRAIRHESAAQFATSPPLRVHRSSRRDRPVPRILPVPRARPVRARARRPSRARKVEA